MSAKLADLYKINRKAREYECTGWNKGDSGMVNTPEGVATYLADNAGNLQGW